MLQIWKTASRPGIGNSRSHAHPLNDDLQIVSLKRRKLLVEDEFARLKN